MFYPFIPERQFDYYCGGGGVTQQPTDKSVLNKGKNTTQSIQVTVNNNTTESMTMRLQMAIGYSDVYVPVYGTNYYSLGSAMTGLVINYQSVPQNTQTTVTLPNNHQVKVSWNSQGDNIIITVDANQS